jgi:hypothetical protein
MPDVIMHEWIRHLNEKVEQHTSDIKRLPKNLSDYRIVDEDSVKAIKTLSDKVLKAQDVSSANFESYMKKTDLEIIESSKYNFLKKLLKMYHMLTPPFDKNNKKHEFPDAIALLTLERWAEKENKKVLAVSLDKGWREFGKNSERVDVEDDLSVALETFNDGAVKAKKLSTECLNDLIQSDNECVMSEIFSFLENEVEAAVIYPEADCMFDYHYENEGMILTGFEFACRDFDSESIHLIRVGTESITLKVPVKLEVNAYADFSFSTGDCVNLGGAHEETELEIEGSILLTLSINADSLEDIVNAELFEYEREIKFGFIHPHDDEDPTYHYY